MRLQLTVTASETGVKDGVRSTHTVATCEGCVLTLTGDDDFLRKVGSTLEIDIRVPRVAQSGGHPHTQSSPPKSDTRADKD